MRAVAPPITAPRLSLLVQSADPHPEAVVLEDLRTGRRERFESLQALARHWLPAPTEPADNTLRGEASCPRSAL